MKKIYILVLALALASSACKKTDLQQSNPNNPNLSSLVTKSGIEYYALGVFQENGSVFDLPNFFMSVMGDEQFSSVGNFGVRFMEQVTGITLPAPYGTVVKNPIGPSQTDELRSLNNFAADAAQSNGFQYAWQDAYLTIGQCNVLIESADKPALSVSANERATLKAWGYWWKGISYSYIGSMYIKGIINDKADGSTNNNYVTHDAIITEANSNFDKAIALLKAIPDTDPDYASTLAAITPSFNVTTIAITPAMWVRNAYTYEARNILVNTKVASLTPAILTQVSDLAGKGLVQGDQAFIRGMDVDSKNDLTAGTQGHPFLWNNDDTNPGWQYISERFVQDFKTTDGKPLTVTSSADDGTVLTSNAADARFVHGIRLLPTPVVNIRSRGILFGSRYTPNAIENGGYWTTGKAHLGQHLYAGSWEENSLMLAEAQIRTGNIEAGLGIIDHVRSAQGAGLAPVAGKSLNLQQALEELREERRIALFLRGVAFYDARRWGVTAPASQGGGRSNAIVLVPNDLTGLTSFAPLPCFIEYNYLDYWDIPVDETAYNPTTPATAQ